MANGSQQQRQQSNGYHDQSKLLWPDQAFALRGSASCDPEKLLDAEAERNQ